MYKFKNKLMRQALMATGFLLFTCSVWAEQAPALNAVPHAEKSASNDQQIEKILVVGLSPLSVYVKGGAFSANQVISSQDMQPQNGASLARVLDSQLLSVSINDVQNNPFQPDVQYRGFTASPLLGLPQGLSVYLNGTRFNEPFGDTVNWDLLPTSALEHVSLVAGANPLFGQNTLGGALLMQSKNGFSFAQNKLSLQGGDYGQQGFNAESGSHSEHWGYYINLNRYQEDGWRDFSNSDIRQGFSSVTYKQVGQLTELTMALSDNSLIGNGAIPVELIPFEGRNAIFTRPDKTATALSLISLRDERDLTANIKLASNIYYRKNIIKTFNGDDSDYEECDLGFGETFCIEGEEDDESSDENSEDENFTEGDLVNFVGHAPFTALEDITAFDPDSIDGTINTSQTKNQSAGLSFELSSQIKVGGMLHAWIVGLGADLATIDFTSDTEFALLNNETAQDSRDVLGIGIFDVDSQVRLKTDVQHMHLLFSDNVALNNHWQLQLSGRINRTSIDMLDGIEVGPGSLNGNHRFTRFNPSLGIRYSKNNFSLHSSLSQSSRAPSPAELSCADPDDPCKLPNGFVADPPLDQVITDTLEVGVKWQFPDGTLEAAVYSSDSNNDIIFQQAGSRPSVGYFVNVDKTRRQGVELGLAYNIGALNIKSQFSYLKATFETSYTAFSPQNPLGPNRQVNHGDNIPGQPNTQGSVSFDYNVNDSLLLNAALNYTSGQYFRGDEANENRKLSGYTLLNLAAGYEFNNGISLAIRLENALDQEFETFGTYGEADEVLGDIYPDITSPEFVGPGQPRTLRLHGSYVF